MLQAKCFEGCSVIKFFESDARTKKKRPFSGVVSKAFLLKGEAYFTVNYDAGDIEDVSMEEWLLFWYQKR